LTLWFVRHNIVL